MSRESKIFMEKKLQISQKVKDYESFGWELLSINGNDVSMSRETQNKVYPDLVKYEHQYEVLAVKRSLVRYPKKPKPFDVLLMIFLAFFLVFPSIIYVFVKLQQKRKYEEDYLYARNEVNRLTEEMTNICNESRATFFSKQA